MSDNKKESSVLGQIIVAVVVALLAGGTSPWWWQEFFGDKKSDPAPLPSNHSFKNDAISGKWVVIEKVKPEQGGWEIIWEFTANVSEKSLTLKGHKTRVNGKEPTRGEKKAVSIFNLTLDGVKAEGTFEETNYRNETLRGNIKMMFAGDFMSLSGRVFQGDEEVGTFTGNKQ
jgi:hypothetical protein